MFLKISKYFNRFLSAENSRTLILKKNIIFSLGIKGLSVAISLVLVPMTIGYINVAQYGIWLTLSSIIGWFAFLDIGLGSGLRNKLAECNALGNFKDAKIFVSTTYATLAIISLTILAVFSIFNRYIDWNQILNISNDQVNNLGQIFLVILVFFCFQFVTQLINTILTALHATSKASLLVLLGQGLSLILIYFLTQTTKGNLLYLAIILAGIPVMVQLIASIFFYKVQFKSFAPNIRFVNFKSSRGLLTLGGLFFIIQMGQLVLYETDNIVISNLFGPKEVTTFNISYKLFSIVIIVFSIFINPFWSAFTDAYTRNDLDWIKQTFLKLQKSWLISALVTFVILALSPLLIHLWLKNKVVVPFALSFSICLNVIATCWHMLCCFLLNGVNKVRLQLYCYLVCFIINIPMSIFLGKMLGITGIVTANFICFAAMGIIFYIQCNKLLNNKAVGIWAQ